MAVYFLPSFHLLHFILSYLSPYESLLLPKLNCLHISALLSHIIFETLQFDCDESVLIVLQSPPQYISMHPSAGCMEMHAFLLTCSLHNLLCLLYAATIIISQAPLCINSLSHFLANTQPQPAHNCTHLSFSEAKLSSILPSLECLCLLEISYFCALK